MLVAFRDADVRAATLPTAVSRSGRTGPPDLALTLAVLVRAPRLADVMGLRSLALTRLTDEALSDYRVGTPASGVRFRPVDAEGAAMATRHTKESLMTVTAITIQAVEDGQGA